MIKINAAYYSLITGVGKSSSRLDVDELLLSAPCT